MTEQTPEQIAADDIRFCCQKLSASVKQASELGLEVSIDVIPYYILISGRKVSAPIVTSTVKRIEVL